MPLFKGSFDGKNHRYGYEIDADVEALTEGEISVELKFSRESLKDSEDRIETSLSVSVENDPENHDSESRDLVIRWGDRILLKTDLMEAENEGSVMDKINHLLNDIPGVLFGGEPFFGCLVKAGLTVTIGQILSCRNSAKKIKGILNKLRSIGDCVRKNFPEMCARFVMRTALCLLKLGF